MPKSWRWPTAPASPWSSLACATSGISGCRSQPSVTHELEVGGLDDARTALQELLILVLVADLGGRFVLVVEQIFFGQERQAPLADRTFVDVVAQRCHLAQRIELGEGFDLHLANPFTGEVHDRPHLFECGATAVG